RSSETDRQFRPIDRPLRQAQQAPIFSQQPRNDPRGRTGVEKRAVIAAFVLHDDPELLAAGCEILPPELPACAEKRDIGERRRQPLELSAQKVVIEADVVASEHMSMPQQS